MIEYDFVVVGTGVSGLSFALEASKYGSVAVITKRASENSNTTWAQGGICCVADDEDSFESHIADTVDAGAGLCDHDVVKTIVESAPSAIEKMVNIGVQFDKNSLGKYELGKEGGHSQGRVLHSKDTTGKEISEKLICSAKESENIEIFEHHFAIDVITTEKLGASGTNEVAGIYVLNESTGEILTFRSDKVVLCTGGCGRVYLYTTNPNIATGDGLAMAYRAGAEISNMEFIQFHPTCLYHHELKNFLISEAVRGEGGKLIGKDGNEYSISEAYEKKIDWIQIDKGFLSEQEKETVLDLCKYAVVNGSHTVMGEILGGHAKPIIGIPIYDEHTNQIEWVKEKKLGLFAQNRGQIVEAVKQMYKNYEEYTDSVKGFSRNFNGNGVSNTTKIVSEILEDKK